MPITDIISPLRHETDRGTITGRLTAIANARVDIVAPLAGLDFVAGQERNEETHEVIPGAFLRSFRLDAGEPLLLPEGVRTGPIRPIAYTRTAMRDVAEMLRIPMVYVDRLDPTHPHLLGANINTLKLDEDRSVYYRLLRVVEDDREEWLLRSVNSSRYRALDNLDMMVAVAQGMTQADLDLGSAEVEADWTQDRFRLRVAIPAIHVVAPDLLGQYRWPFAFDPTGDTHRRWSEGDGTPPVLWAGFEVENSETGQGAAQITPRLVVQVCRNGWKRKVDVLRTVHAGARLEEGAVDWSPDTRRLQTELLTSQIADAVKVWCSTGYLERCVDEAMVAAGVPVANVAEAVRVLAAQQTFTEAETTAVLDAFTRGGDLTVAGLGQAVTAAARTVESGDRQAEMEAMFWDIVARPDVFAGA